MREATYFFLTFFISIISYAQQLHPQWTNSISDVGQFNSYAYYDYIPRETIVVDGNGFIYIAGFFSGTKTFADINLTSAGELDIYLLKYTPEKLLVWAKRIGGPSNDGIDEDFPDFEEGKLNLSIVGSDLYISGFAGYLNQTINFNTPSTYTINTLDIPETGMGTSFIAKFNTSGSFQWAKQYKGSIADVEATSTSIYFSLSFNGTASLGTVTNPYNVTSQGYSDVLLAKLDNNGVVQWARRMGNLVDYIYFQYYYRKNADEAGQIIIDGSNIYISGNFLAYLSFDQTEPFSYQISTGGGRFESFVAKFDASGNFIWAIRVPYCQDKYGPHITLNSSGLFVSAYFGIALSNNFNTPSDESTNNVSNVGGQSYLAKFNPTNGSFIWAKRIYGEVHDIESNSSSIYLTGNYFTNNAEFFFPNSLNNDHLQLYGNSDIFLAKCDNSGNMEWLQRSGNNSIPARNYWETGVDLFLRNNYVYLLGHYSSDNIFSFGSNESVLTQTQSQNNIFFTKLFEGNNNIDMILPYPTELSYCAGTNFSVGFEASWTFQVGNTFQVQMSSSSGDFSNPVNVGSGTASPISCQFPLNLPQGQGYKYRIVSNFPKIIGATKPFLYGLEIFAPSKGGTVTGGTTVCTGSTTPMPITLNGHTGNILKWQQSSTSDFASPLDINITSTTISVGNMTADRYFRAVVKNGNCPSANSVATNFTVSPTTVAGSLSSVNGIFCAGTNNNTINLTGKTGSVLKWQSSSNSTFTSPLDIANTTTSLNVENISSSTFYRAIVKSGACAEANSSGRQIAISSGPTTLPNSFPLNNITYPVKSNFTITGQNLVSGNSNVLYRSNKAVELKPGFRAKNGTIFKAEIGICN